MRRRWRRLRRWVADRLLDAGIAFAMTLSPRATVAVFLRVAALGRRS